MSDWQRKVDFSAYTEKYNEGELSIQEFAKIVAEKLKTLRKFEDEYINNQLEEIIWSFEDLADDEECMGEASTFNYLLEDLYNWGDTPSDDKFGGKKVCWIQMRSANPALRALRSNKSPCDVGADLR